MKITKERLKEIIKEELDTAITQEGFLDMFKGKAKETPEDKKLRQALINVLPPEDISTVPGASELAQMRADDERTYNALKNAVIGKTHPQGMTPDRGYHNPEMNQLALKVWDAYRASPEGVAATKRRSADRASAELATKRKAQSDSEEAANIARREKEKARKAQTSRTAQAIGDLEGREITRARRRRGEISETEKEPSEDDPNKVIARYPDPEGKNPDQVIYKWQQDEFDQHQAAWKAFNKRNKK